MVDILEKKRDGGKLSEGELVFFVEGLCSGEIPDYQASALLMAIYLRGMDRDETALLTGLMARSGEQIDLSGIEGIKVDKHSTGGVGDKTTLVIAAVAASCGAKVAKMSGRALGHSGGTIDKLEAIPGLSTALTRQEFVQQVNRIGVCIAGQTGNLAPADKKLYALRDVTATVSSIPLIASSVMSKKLASGADKLLLDVKTGSGALLGSVREAEELARTMVEIGERNGRETVALLTDMDSPLGCGVGNLIEVEEAVSVLRGEGPEDLTSLCLTLSAEMLALAGKGSREACLALAEEAVRSGRAYRKFREMVTAQGGDFGALEQGSAFPRAAERRDVLSPGDGYVAAMRADLLGRASMLLGAGRREMSTPIDYQAGLILRKKTGMRVRAGEALATMISTSPESFGEAEALIAQSYAFCGEAPPKRPLVLARIDKTGLTRLV